MTSGRNVLRVFAIAALAGAGVLLIAGEGTASHYWGSTLWWDNRVGTEDVLPLAGVTLGDTVAISGTQVWRWSALGTAPECTTVEGGGAPTSGTLGIRFTDGGSEAFDVLVLETDGEHDVARTRIVARHAGAAGIAACASGDDDPSLDVIHRLATPEQAPGVPHRAYWQTCCRIGYGWSGNYHINNPDTPMRLETAIPLQVPNKSPVVQVPTVKACAIRMVCRFPLIANDPDGDALTFRLSTSQEATGQSCSSTYSNCFYQPGPDCARCGSVLHPLQVDPATGDVTWDTTGAEWALTTSSSRNLYSVHMMVGDGTTEVPVDFMIQLVEPPETLCPDGSIPPIDDETGEFRLDRCAGELPCQDPATGRPPCGIEGYFGGHAGWTSLERTPFAQTVEVHAGVVVRPSLFAQSALDASCLESGLVLDYGDGTSESVDLAIMYADAARDTAYAKVATRGCAASPVHTYAFATGSEMYRLSMDVCCFVARDIVDATTYPVRLFSDVDLGAGSPDFGPDFALRFGLECLADDMCSHDLGVADPDDATALRVADPCDMGPACMFRQARYAKPVEVSTSVAHGLTWDTHGAYADFYQPAPPAYVVGILAETDSGEANAVLPIFLVGSRPVAVAVLSEGPYYVGESISATSWSYDRHGTIVSTRWDAFGQTVHAWTASLVPSEAGHQTVTLTVSDGTYEDSESVSVDVHHVTAVASAPESARTLEPVKFTADVTATAGLASSTWTFSDGGSADGLAVTREFDEPGLYAATITVTDHNGRQATDTVEVAILGRPPEAAWAVTVQGLQATFADGSTDMDGAIVAWSWDFGDGATSTQQHPVHLYADYGTYTVTLTVTDDDGDKGTHVGEVALAAPPNQVPTASWMASWSGVKVTFSDGSTDPDGTLSTWLWDFGDGATSGEASPTHRFKPGTYTVSLTVTDDDGATATLAKAIDVPCRTSVLGCTA